MQNASIYHTELMLEAHRCHPLQPHNIPRRSVSARSYVVEVGPRLTLQQVPPRRNHVRVLVHERQQHVVGGIDVPRRVWSERRTQIIPIFRLEEEQPAVSILGLYVAVRGGGDAWGRGW